MINNLVRFSKIHFIDFGKNKKSKHCYDRVEKRKSEIILIK